MSRPRVPHQASYWLRLLQYSVTWDQYDIVKVLTATCSPHHWTVNAFQKEIGVVHSHGATLVNWAAKIFYKTATELAFGIE